MIIEIKRNANMIETVNRLFPIIESTCLWHHLNDEKIDEDVYSTFFLKEDNVKYHFINYCTGMRVIFESDDLEQDISISMENVVYLR